MTGGSSHTRPLGSMPKVGRMNFKRKESKMKHIGEILAREVKKPPTSNGLPASTQSKDGSKSNSEPACPVCKDVGMLHPLREDGNVDYRTVIPCACRAEEIKKRRAEHLLRYCQLPERTESKTFETFEDRDPKCKEAKAMAYRIAQGDEDTVFLTLLSATGRGKSHLAIAICREWLKRGVPAKYAYVPELLDEIRDSYQRDEIMGQSYSQFLDLLKRVPLLVLDDLGTEKKSEWATEKLQQIIEHRSRSILPLVVTTNKPLDELPNDDEGRISGRLQRESWCKVVVF